MPDTNEILEQAMQTPKSASEDGQSVTSRDASELIALDEHLTKKQATSAGKMPFKVFREVLPGPG